MPTEFSNYFVPEDSRYIAVMTPPGFIKKELKQVAILLQPSKCYTVMSILYYLY